VVKELDGSVGLGMSSNELTGTIPLSLGTLTELTSLQMYAIRLSCTIPSWLGNLTALSDLGMSHNELNGTIPSSWGMFDIHVGFGDEQQYPDQIHALLNW
jgi:Leucine-rich repeat (LRR) protein